MMNAFALGGAEILVVLVVSVIVAAVVAAVLAIAVALGRRSAKTPKPGVKNVESRLRELDGLREKHLISDEEYQERRAAILGEI